LFSVLLKFWDARSPHAVRSVFGVFVCGEGVNFINILLKTFSYKTFLCSFSIVTVWLWNILISRILVQKSLIKCWWNCLKVVNFINILLETFSCKSALCIFSPVIVCFCNFFGARILAQKLLVKCWWNCLKASFLTAEDES